MTRRLLPTAGRILREARVRKGDTLNEASRGTRVPKKLIEAIEENRREDFAAPIYFSGFLKIYCDYLSVDFDSLWDDASKGAAESPSCAVPSDSPIDKANPGQSPPDQSHRIIIAGSLIALAAAALLVRWAARRAHLPREIPSLDAGGSSHDRADYRMKLTVIFHRSAWLSVIADGKSAFNGRIDRGAMRKWKARRSLFIKTNSPKAFDLMLNGEPYLLPKPDAENRYKIEAR
ncbi:MAG: helix-turn-helix domain-containing protein [Elusimicrobiota bacterium]